MSAVSAEKRRALVTGGAQRVGRAISIALAADGWSVGVHFNRSKETAQALAQSFPHAVAVGADFSDRQALDRLVEQSAEGLGGPLSLLVNCASTFEPDDVTDFNWEAWDVHMASNLEAPCRLAQHFARQPDLDRVADPAIINIIDQRVLRPNPQFFSYSIAKSGLAFATRTMAQTLAPGIRVNAILPGPTLRNARQDEASWQKQYGATLLERPSDPDEIVRALRYLIEARAVTGALLPVDAGQHLVWQTPDVFGVKE
jgi:NAD(P)-dependent dehydrogenase (short-subunit alcohol dehydrogenase family)